ncbi:rna-directed dna polymerase from mobile element jockey-like protein [Lasius niger]|uniref:Rna-directed dna polymerase from mobile element jockey-like protein n=1 Tax=Lasius niger TaxID=67767 RepID=A0A0J7L1W6_LASNI|nr:rna-directed dna polymerase from mobile element jockey-like protein [Lasius niger]
MIRNRRKDINENYTTTKISAEDWYKHFKNMYDQIPTGDELTGRQTEENTIRIETEDIMKALKNLRGRKAPGLDGIPNELLGARN